MKSELSVTEAAFLVGRSPDTVWRWIRAGRLRAVETSAGLVVDSAEVVALTASFKRGRPRVESS